MYLNRRLLEYPYPGLDPSKLGSKHYCKRVRGKLLVNWYWYKTGDLVETLLYARDRLKGKWVNFVLDSCPVSGVLSEVLLHVPEKEISKDTLLPLTYDNTCECGRNIPRHRQFCSNKCSAHFVTQSEEYREKLSRSLKGYYHDSADQTERNEKISKTAKEINSGLSEAERKSRYSNNTDQRSAFDSFSERYPGISLLVQKDEFYNLRDLPARCDDCLHEWEITKSTNYSRALCPICNPPRKHKTQTEIFEELSREHSVRQNVRRVIDGEIDILLPDHKVGIEYDGLLPHSYGYSPLHYYSKSASEIDRKYHLRKTEAAEAEGIHLFHVFENEYLDPVKRKIWWSMIRNRLGRSRRVYARKCSVREVPAEVSRDFVNRTHLQGNCRSSVKLGLFHEGSLVSVMTFRKHQRYQWEIARFCSELETVVVGGAGKLLKHFEGIMKPKSLLSYANRRWSRGGLYETLGFSFVENTKPGYFYFRINENILYPREKFQKHKLAGILESFDPKKTETENTLDNGYRVIFDCGHKKYVKKYEKP